MTEAVRIIKLILTFGFVVAGSVALWLSPAMAVPLFVGGIAWAHIPT